MTDFITSWYLDPTILGGSAFAVALYAFGWRRLRERGQGRKVLASWRAWSFGLGILSMWVALLSPIGVYSELFFFMHMTQHLILVLVTAPLLLLGAPLLPTLWALPKGLRVKAGLLFAPGNPMGKPVGILTHPLTTVSLYVIVMAVWHVPPLYDAAQGRTLVHDLEHFSFMASATLFWWPVIHPAGGRRRLSYAAGIPYFIPPLMEGNLIGALLVFADRPLYAAYRELPRVWGISALQDQQMAGLIMWVPGGLIFIVPIFILLTLLFQEESRRSNEAGTGLYKEAARRGKRPEDTQ